jgi:hypothetical protein
MTMEKIAYCKLCGKKFIKTTPNNLYCCEECKNTARKKFQISYHKKKHIPNKNKAMKTCKICGEILPDARQKYCEKCLLEISTSRSKKGSWARKVLRHRGIDETERLYLLEMQEEKNNERNEQGILSEIRN